MRLACSFVLGAVVIAFAPSGAEAGDPSFQEKIQALGVIKDFTPSICPDVPTGQNNSKTELGADAQAKLKGLTKLLAGAGISADAKHTVNKSQGLRQEDLVIAMRDGQTCRLAVFNRLTELFLADNPTAAKGQPPSARAAPPNTPAVQSTASKRPPGTLTPVSFKSATGGWSKQGPVWIEQPEYAPGLHFAFTQLSHDKDYVYLVDRSRQKPGEENNPMILRLPIKGGEVGWSYQNPLQWSPFAIVQAGR